MQPSGQSRARQLIDEAVDLDAEDLAYDFVETQVGRFFYDSSWKLKKDHYLGKLRGWLEDQGYGEKLKAVSAVIDKLSAEGHTWNDRWSDDYSGMDKPRSTKRRPKPRSQPHGQPTQPGRPSAP